MQSSRRALRILFFGTAEFAVPSLMALLEAGHEVIGVVTQPDKPTGRGLQLSQSPVKRAAESRGLVLYQPKRVRSPKFIEMVRELAPEAIALAAFGQIMPQSLLDIPPLGPVNVHGSLLPKYRGAAPVQRAILAGESETGVTTMWMDATLDTGDMLLRRVEPILPDDTSETLLARLAVAGAELLVETLEGLAAGTVSRISQDDSQATLAPAILPSDGYVRWEEPAGTVHNRVRAVSPRPGAYTVVNGRRVKIWRTTILDELTSEAPGTVIRMEKKPAGIALAAGDGKMVLLLEAQPESGKRMPAADWARGARIAPGMRFEDIA
jgi:methionyl-tRNA formyltransferase